MNGFAWSWAAQLVAPDEDLAEDLAELVGADEEPLERAQDCPGPRVPAPWRRSARWAIVAANGLRAFYASCTHCDVSPIDRREQFHLRIAPEELDMLRALADDEGLSASDIIRTLVRRRYRDRFGDKPPKKPKKK